VIFAFFCDHSWMRVRDFCLRANREIYGFNLCSWLYFPAINFTQKFASPFSSVFMSSRHLS